MIKSTYFRADKILFKGGISCSIWIPFEEDEDMGICFDWPDQYTDDLIEILTRLKHEPAKIYDETE